MAEMAIHPCSKQYKPREMAQQWRKGQCRAGVKGAEGIAQLNHFCLELPFLSSVCLESHSLCAGTWLQYLMK